MKMKMRLIIFYKKIIIILFKKMKIIIKTLQNLFLCLEHTINQKLQITKIKLIIILIEYLLQPIKNYLIKKLFPVFILPQKIIILI